MILIYSAFLLILTYGVVIWIALYYFNRLKPFSPLSKPTTSVSILVAARNEGNCIGHCIESLLEQNYPTELIEIIIIDDQSDDDTAKIISSYANKGVRLISIEDKAIVHGKKAAITKGISYAKGKLIVTTDADCTMNKNWLATISSFYEATGAVFIAGPVKFEKEKSLLGIFQSLDFLSLQGITAAGVGAGLYTMCNGANLAYEKEAFIQVNGFKGVDHIASGDDMLLMEKIKAAYPGKVHYCFSQDAIVETASAKSIQEFITQRIRWASKAPYYKSNLLKYTLLLVYLVNLILLCLLIMGLFSWKYLMAWLILTLIKTLIEFPFMYRVADFFTKKNVLIWFLPIQPVHNTYTVIAGFFGLFSTYTWKGRRLK
jgi:cellulose synthase/poly-beta-1,6-N-acetylglucosamine synthase-like glycosyltransferase